MGMAIRIAVPPGGVEHPPSGHANERFMVTVFLGTIVSKQPTGHGIPFTQRNEPRQAKINYSIVICRFLGLLY